MGEVKVVKMDVKHLKEMNVHGRTKEVVGNMTEADFEFAATLPYAFSVLYEGRAVMCTGIRYWSDEIREAWAIFDEECKACFTELNSIAKALLDNYSYPVVEAYVDKGFKNGHRWVRALGFKRRDDLELAFNIEENVEKIVYVRGE